MDPEENGEYHPVKSHLACQNANKCSDIEMDDSESLKSIKPVSEEWVESAVQIKYSTYTTSMSH
jgi:hypothetical protein